MSDFCPLEYTLTKIGDNVPKLFVHLEHNRDGCFVLSFDHVRDHAAVLSFRGLNGTPAEMREIIDTRLANVNKVLQEALRDNLRVS